MFLNSIYSNVYVVTVLFRTVQFSLHGSPVYCNWQPMGEPIWKCCWFCFSPPAMLPASSVCLAPLCLNGASESSAAAVCCMTLKSLESAELKGKMEDSKMLSCQLSVLTRSQISGVAACPFFYIHKSTHFFPRYYRNEPPHRTHTRVFIEIVMGVTLKIKNSAGERQSF